jgi:hypothetical protein
MKDLQYNKTVNDHMADILGLVRFQKDKRACLDKIS